LDLGDEKNNAQKGKQMATILIVDDDLQIQRLLTKILEEAGYPTLASSDGEACLLVCKEKRPDLLIIDMVMPTGKELKQVNTDVKIIDISGGGKLAPDSCLPMAKQFGAIATFEKPIDRDEILVKVQSTLG
jgi:DNA-binding NtrC family response regulator